MLLASSASAQLFNFCYNGVDSIPFYIDSGRVTFRLAEGSGEPELDSLVLAVDRIDDIVEDPDAVDSFVVCELTDGSDYEDFLDSLQALADVYLVEPYYRTSDGMPVLVGTRFTVAFSADVPQATIDSINTANGVVIDHELYGMANVFLLRNTDSSGIRLLEIANTYHEMSETRYAKPDFRSQSYLGCYRVFDYYHSYQDHIKKVIGSFDSASVWDFAGLTRPVTVAVIDDGVEYGLVYHHEDLPYERVLDGYDYADDDNIPSPPPRRAHGMGCAGIIAASHTTDSVAGLQDSTGVISINPNALILPLKIFPDDYKGAYDSDESEAIMRAADSGAEVLSMSWGYTGGKEVPHSDVIDACDSAFIKGRNGLGCVLVASAGNSGQGSQPGVHIPARQSSCLAVGAIQLNDSIWPYSCRDTTLDLVAPSGATCLQGDVWTLDRMDFSGYNPYVDTVCDSTPVVWDCPTLPCVEFDYNCHFGGTSAACPIVSGVASLVLARDSTLTASEVHAILCSSAVHELGWGTLPDTSLVEYGWGRVDAFRAILSISRGNIDNSEDCLVDNADLVYLVDYMYTDGPPPFPSEPLADLNCDGDVDISDMVLLVDYIYMGGPPPVNPCYKF